jgi:large subunit ribosomal protein L21
MFAVVRLKNRQYRLSEGDVVAVDKINAGVGSQLELGDVLMVGDEGGVEVGAPILGGARVTAEVVAHERGPKVEVFKFRRRKSYRKLRGHRQPYTLVKVLSVTIS